MSTIRNPENVSETWSKVFQCGCGGFGVFLSLVSALLIIIWLASEEGGGLGVRSDTVTAEYFNWHPLLMTVAFLALMGPATAAFEVYSVFSRAMNKNIHATLQTMAVVAVTAGYVIIYDCHVVLGDNGLATSMHSIAGYMTMALVGLVYAMGLVLYVLKWGAELRGSLKPLHKRMGFMALLMGYATILMGMTEKANGMEGLTLQFTQVIVGLIVGAAVCVSCAVLKFVDKKDGGDFKYTPIIEEDALVHLM